MALISNGTTIVTGGSLASGIGGSGGGKVLQVLQSNSTGHTSFSSNSWTTYLSQSITPSSTSSKILCMTSINASQSNNNSFNMVSLWRGGTIIARGNSLSSLERCWIDLGMNNNANEYIYTVKNVNSQWLDSPSTTSAITYYVKIKVKWGGTLYTNRTANTADGNRTSTVSAFTLMEIGT